MRRGMVTHGGFTYRTIDLSVNLVAARYSLAVRDVAVVKNYALMCFSGVFNGKFKSVALDNADVADLTAAFRIERSFGKHKCYIVIFRCSLFLFAVNYNSEYLAVARKCFIADERGFIHSLGGIARALPSLCACVLVSLASFFASLGHKSRILLLVNGHTLFVKNVLCKVKRETVSIGELKRIGTAHNLTVGGFNHFLEHIKARINGLCEVFLLRFNNIYDKVVLFKKTRVSCIVLFNNRLGNLIKEGSVNTEQSAVACCAAQKTS